MRGSKPFALALLHCAICTTGWALEPDAGQVSSLNEFPAGVPMPLRVGVGLYIADLNQLNESTGTYQGQIQLRYRWRDPALAFSAASMGFDVQVFAAQEASDKLASIWDPQIVVSNLLGGSNTTSTGLMIHPDGTVELIQTIKGTFETRLKLANFPFDQQDLPVVILSSRYSSNQVVLVQEESEVKVSGLDPALKLSGWRIGNLSFKRGQVTAWNGLLAEQLTANLRIKRMAASILSTIFIPLLLLLIVPTIVSLIPSFELSAQLTAWANSILALIALNFTLSLRFQGLDEGSLIGRVVMTGHIYQLVSVLLTVSLFNPKFTARMRDPFVESELSDYLHWAIPVGFVGVLILETLLLADSW